jgi:hypothetical protein
MFSLPQVACQKFAGTLENKRDGLAKNFSSQRDGLALQFSEMKYPASSGKLVPSNFIHFPGRPF